MARRRKGRAIDGWLLIDKPLGVTSTQVVAKARWALQAQKAGHGGTLDPLATGLLAIALGEATKTVAIAQEGLKTYQFTVRLGQTTSTDDAEGEVIASSDTRPTDREIAATLPAFVGEIQQIPPQFSAVKIEGQRAYDLARAGQALDLAARSLWVEALELIDRPDTDHAVLQMICGKGGYVRSIARDLGAALGCGSHVTALRRLASGGFTLDAAIPFDALDAIRARDGACDALLPVAAGLSGLPELAITPAQAKQLRHGQAVSVVAMALGYGDMCWASEAGAPVAVCRYKDGLIFPGRVIHPSGFT